MSNIEEMKRQLVEKQRKQRAAALTGLEDLEQMTYPLTGCVKDCNGEPGNGWTPDLVEAARLIRLMYWKTARVRALLEGRDTDGCDIEIALCESGEIVV
jgi:hypothetical protein